MRLSLRTRFALASGTLVLLVSAAVAIAGYLSLRHTLHDQARRSAAGQAAQLAGLIDTGRAETAGTQNGNFVDIRDPSLIGQLAGEGVSILVAGPNGKTLQASRGAPLDLAAGSLLAACRRAGAAHATRTRPPAAVACRRIGTTGKPLGFVLVAAPLSGAEHTLATTRRALVAGVLGGGIGSFLLAWLLAGRALRPLRRIAQTARSIREGDLKRRIGYAGRDELGELATELDSSFAELEGALRRQERFVADASHELKSPLTAARANAELLRRWAAEEPAARADALIALERSTARMGRLVSDLIQLAEGDDRLRYAHDAVRLDDLVLEAEREARPLADRVAVSVDHIEQAVVVGDRDRLAQLLGNLVDNALRVTPADGTVRLTLSQEGERVLLSVSDGGPGIPDEELLHLFDRFYRGRLAEPGSGSGLGLAIAQAIAHAHGGEITVVTRPGEGSVFTAVLPSG